MVKACSENLEACAETMSYSRENFYSLFDNVLRCVEKKYLLSDQVKSGDSVLILALIIRLLHLV